MPVLRHHVSPQLEVLSSGFIAFSTLNSPAGLVLCGVVGQPLMNIEKLFSVVFWILSIPRSQK